MAMNTNAMKEAASKAVNPTLTKDEQKAKKVKAPTQVVGELLAKYAPQIREALGKAMDAERFTRLLTTVIAQNPNLLRACAECPASLVGAILTAAQLGLEPNTPLGHGYLIPYFEKDKNASMEQGHDVYVMRVSFQLGYQGVLLLAYRSGDIADVDAQVVYAKDSFKYQLGTNRFINHVPTEDPEPGDPVRYYAVIQLKSGGQLFKVWSYNQVMTHAKKFSKSFNQKYGKFFGPWADNFNSMALKTVLLDCLKLAPKSSSLAAQVATDNTTKSIPANMDHVDMLSQRNEDYLLTGEETEKEAIAVEAEVIAEAEKVPVRNAIRNKDKGEELDLADIS